MERQRVNEELGWLNLNPNGDGFSVDKLSEIISEYKAKGAVKASFTGDEFGGAQVEFFSERDETDEEYERRMLFKDFDRRNTEFLEFAKMVALSDAPITIEGGNTKQPKINGTPKMFFVTNTPTNERKDL